MKTFLARVIAFVRTVLSPTNEDRIEHDVFEVATQHGHTHIMLVAGDPIASGDLTYCRMLAKEYATKRGVSTQVLTLRSWLAQSPEAVAQRAVIAAATHPASAEELAAALKAQNTKRSGIVLPPAAIEVARQRKESILAAEDFTIEELMADVDVLRHSRYNEMGIYKHVSDAIKYPDSRAVSIRQVAQIAYWAQAIRFLNGKPLVETKLSSVDDGDVPF